MRSTLRMTGDRDVDIEQYAVLASVSYATPSRWSVRLGLGAVMDGSLSIDGRTHEIGPGLAISIGASRLWVRDAWFVAGAFAFGASRASTRETVAGAASTSVTASDARLGITAGRSFGTVSPYALARAFGGPVSWRLDGMSLTGGDAHHYQLGAGASIGPLARWSLVLDLAVLGERGASLGLAREL